MSKKDVIIYNRSVYTHGYHLDSWRARHGSVDSCYPLKAYISVDIGDSRLYHLLIVSVWHSMKADESDLTDPKREKYQRKVEKSKIIGRIANQTNKKR